MQPKEMVGFLVLINQLICKFNSLVGDILEEIFPAIASRVFHILPIEAIPSGPGTNTEVQIFYYLTTFIYTFYGQAINCVASFSISLLLKTKSFLPF